MSILPPTADFGRRTRYHRVFSRRDQRSFVLPLDHGLAQGVLPGLSDTRALVAAAVAGGVDALLLRPGLLRLLEGLDLGGTGLILGLTGRLSRGVDHVGINSVEEAVRFGADAVSLEVKVGSPGELETLRTVVPLVEEASRYGLPVLLKVYPVPEYKTSKGAQAHIHACRIAVELGADFVKTEQPDDETLRACLEVLTPRVPLLVAGGDAGDFAKLRDRVAGAISLGAAGAAVGRNVFTQPDPAGSIRELAAAVHG
jgi:DhnA family fructose-bisphosphate aldolase class Ia